MSRDKRYLSSCSHDNTVKLWNVAYLYEADGDVGEAFKAGGYAAPDAPPAAAATDDMDDDDSDAEEGEGDGEWRQWATVGGPML